MVLITSLVTCENCGYVETFLSSMKNRNYESYDNSEIDEEEDERAAIDGAGLKLT